MEIRTLILDNNLSCNIASSFISRQVEIILFKGIEIHTSNDFTRTIGHSQAFGIFIFNTFRREDVTFQFHNHYSQRICFVFRCNKKNLRKYARDKKRCGLMNDTIHRSI